MVVLPMRPLLATPRLDQRVRVVVVRDEAAAFVLDRGRPSTARSNHGGPRSRTSVAEVRVVGSAELRATMEWAA